MPLLLFVYLSVTPPWLNIGQASLKPYDARDDPESMSGTIAMRYGR